MAAPYAALVADVEAALLDFGVTDSRLKANKLATLAAERCSSVEAAIEWCMMNPDKAGDDVPPKPEAEKDKGPAGGEDDAGKGPAGGGGAGAGGDDAEAALVLQKQEAALDENFQTLLAMGYTKGQSTKAVRSCSSLEGMIELFKQV